MNLATENQPTPYDGHRYNRYKETLIDPLQSQITTFSNKWQQWNNANRSLRNYFDFLSMVGEDLQEEIIAKTIKQIQMTDLFSNAEFSSQNDFEKEIRSLKTTVTNRDKNAGFLSTVLPNAMGELRGKVEFGRHLFEVRTRNGDNGITRDHYKRRFASEVSGKFGSNVNAVEGHLRRLPSLSFLGKDLGSLIRIVESLTLKNQLKTNEITDLKNDFSLEDYVANIAKSEGREETVSQLKQEVDVFVKISNGELDSGFNVTVSEKDKSGAFNEETFTLSFRTAHKQAEKSLSMLEKHANEGIPLDPTRFGDDLSKAFLVGGLPLAQLIRIPGIGTICLNAKGKVLISNEDINEGQRKKSFGIEAFNHVVFRNFTLEKIVVIAPKVAFEGESLTDKFNFFYTPTQEKKKPFGSISVRGNLINKQIISFNSHLVVYGSLHTAFLNLNNGTLLNKGEVLSDHGLTVRAQNLYNEGLLQSIYDCYFDLHPLGIIQNYGEFLAKSMSIQARWLLNKGEITACEGIWNIKQVDNFHEMRLNDLRFVENAEYCHYFTNYGHVYFKNFTFNGHLENLNTLKVTQKSNLNLISSLILAPSSTTVLSELTLKQAGKSIQNSGNLTLPTPKNIAPLKTLLNQKSAIIHLSEGSLKTYMTLNQGKIALLGNATLVAKTDLMNLGVMEITEVGNGIHQNEINIIPHDNELHITGTTPYTFLGEFRIDEGVCKVKSQSSHHSSLDLIHTMVPVGNFSFHLKDHYDVHLDENRSVPFPQDIVWDIENNCSINANLQFQGNVRLTAQNIEVTGGGMHSKKSLNLQARDTIRLIEASLSARSISTKSELYWDTSSNLFSGEGGTSVEAHRILIETRKTEKCVEDAERDCSTSGTKKTEHTKRHSQEATASLYLSKGDTTFKATEVILMEAPYVMTKDNLTIDAPRTTISSVFLVDRTEIETTKKRLFGGGSKCQNYREDVKDVKRPTLVANKLHFKKGETDLEGANICVYKFESDTILNIRLAKTFLHNSVEREGYSAINFSQMNSEQTREIGIPSIIRSRETELNKKTILSGVCADLGETIVNEDFIIASPYLESKGFYEYEKIGVNLPGGINKSFKDPLLSGINSLLSSSGLQQALNGISGASNLIDGANTIASLLGGANPFQVVMGRYCGISVGVERVNNQWRAIDPMVSKVLFKSLRVKNKYTSFTGEVTCQEPSYLTTEVFEIGTGYSSYESRTTTTNTSISYNPFANSVSAAFHYKDCKSNKEIYVPTVLVGPFNINTKLYKTVDNFENNGAVIKSERTETQHVENKDETKERGFGISIGNGSCPLQSLSIPIRGKLIDIPVGDIVNVHNFLNDLSKGRNPIQETYEAECKKQEQQQQEEEQSLEGRKVKRKNAKREKRRAPLSEKDQEEIDVIGDLIQQTEAALKEAEQEAAREIRVRKERTMDIEHENGPKMKVRAAQAQGVYVSQDTGNQANGSAENADTRSMILKPAHKNHGNMKEVLPYQDITGDSTESYIGCSDILAKLSEQKKQIINKFRQESAMKADTFGDIAKNAVRKMGDYIKAAYDIGSEKLQQGFSSLKRDPVNAVKDVTLWTADQVTDFLVPGGTEHIKDCIKGNINLSKAFARQVESASVEVAMGCVVGKAIKGLKKSGQALLNVGESIAEQAAKNAGKDVAKVTQNTMTSAAEFEAKFGKKVVQNMKTEEFIQSVANRADGAVPGMGPVVGTLKHQYAENLGSRYQKITGDKGDLVFEQRYKNGQLYTPGMGLKGSAIPDVYNRQTGKAYDYKYGKGRLSKKQEKKLKEHLPKKESGGFADIVVVTPNTSIKK